MIKIAPSILAADPLNMERDVRRMAEAGCDMIHVDVMDAHFVPNLSYGPALVEALHGRFDLPLDVHLMMDNPEKYVDVFAAAGAWGSGSFLNNGQNKSDQLFTVDRLWLGHYFMFLR